MALIPLAPKATVCCFLSVILIAVLVKRLGEGHCKIHRARSSPAIRLAVPGNQRIILYTHNSPYILFIVVIDAMYQIENNMHAIAFREGILMETNTGSCRKLCKDVIAI